MRHSLVVRHNFETAHRLPHLGGKCENLHGHSWWAEVTVGVPALDDRGTVVEFGAFKHGLREWIDRHLDHGAMLGAADPLTADLPLRGSHRVFRFGAADPSDAEKYAADLEWPTVENVAVLVRRVARDALEGLEHADSATVDAVRVTETHVNGAAVEESA